MTTNFEENFLLVENEKLKTELDMVRKELAETVERLKKYTNGDNNKRYYEKNKELVKKKAEENMRKLKDKDPDKIKEYAHKAYLKQKEKKNLIRIKNGQ
jgi:hypothetical protein